MMIARAMTLFACHMAAKYGFGCLSAKWLPVTDQTPTAPTPS